MKRRIALLLTIALAFESVSCGTLIHPERRGQPHTALLDPSIVLLDGLGVLVFLVPGVVAFIVDFATGAIYLPEPPLSPYPPPPRGYPVPAPGPPPAAYPPTTWWTPSSSLSSPTLVRLTRINTSPGTLTRERIEAVLLARTGHAIKLNAPDVRVIRANDLQDASATLRAVDLPAR
jgi:hypothetical protein